jgi:acetaldehyde dehydrogenase (acetylating)
MTHHKTSMILATGGSDMVQAAYSSGKPALGVGPGNVPAYVHASADIHDAAKKIVLSKTFDNGTVCSSEQAIIADRSISAQLVRELEQLGAAFLCTESADKLTRVLFTPRGTISPSVVGKPADFIARTAQIQLPADTRVLIVRPDGIGNDHPLSREKLSPVLAYYEVDNAEDGCDHCIRLLKLGGLGHSLVIHAKDESVISEFALKKPVSRLLVNTPSSLGAIGYTTSLTPSMTLGCGTMGGNATSDNITASHLINIKRVARHQQVPESDSTAADQPVTANESISMLEIRRLVADMVINRQN